MSSEKIAENPEEEEEPSQPEKESKLDSKGSGSLRDLLRDHAEHIQQAVSRMEVHRKRKFYFLTIPGLIRVVQVLFAFLNISVFGYYCTCYDEIKGMLPPYCLAQTKEQYFMLCNYHSLFGCLTIILAGVFSPFSNAALLSSLYPLLFDSIQAFLLLISSITLMQFYKTKNDKINEVMPDGISAKIGMSFVGFTLAFLHVASAIYDLILFLKYLHDFRSEQKSMQKEEQSLLQ